MLVQKYGLTTQDDVCNRACCATVNAGTNASFGSMGYVHRKGLPAFRSFEQSAINPSSMNANPALEGKN